MRDSTTAEEIEAALADALPEVEVVDVELAGRPGRSVLRVFIDHPEGVDHDLCVKVTGLLDRYLEDHEVEVSSPGLERRLRKPEHFRGVVGEKINVKTYGPVEGRRNFTGFLVEVTGTGIVVELQDRSVAIAFDQVSRAKKVLEFPSGDEPKSGRKKKRPR